MNNLSSKNNTKIKAGEIYWVDLPLIKEGVQGGMRPCILLGNNNAIAYSPVITVIPVSSRMNKVGKIPTHVILDGLKRKSFALIEQIQTVPKSNLIGKSVCSLSNNEICLIKEAINKQFGL